MLMDTPLIQEIAAEFRRTGQVEMIVHILQGKFGPVGPTIEAGLALVKEDEKLMRLGARAGACASLRAFEDALREELPASTRGKRRPRMEME